MTIHLILLGGSGIETAVTGDTVTIINTVFNKCI